MSDIWGSCRSVLKRSQYSPAQAIAAAQASCTNASQIRQLALTFFTTHTSPPPIILDRNEHERQNRPPKGEQWDPGAGRPSQGGHRRSRGAGHQQRIQRERSAVAPADLHQALVVVLAVRLPRAR